jgi:carboxylate-amine ligase
MALRGEFHRNTWPTLGVEIELQLVDARTMALRSAIEPILRDLPAGLRDSVKPEFMQCYVEINTQICRTVDEVRTDLRAKLRALEPVADRHGVGLLWAATHPFSRWRDQRITPDVRYYRLAEMLGETVVRAVTFGLHVHVGVDSGDKAVQVGDRLLSHLPMLLALSANSPFWHGRFTGHHAHRIEVLEGFPTGGLPPRLRSWDEYLGLVGQLQAAGFIESEREIWWDVRPNAENGTIEVRICDMPPGLSELLGLTALIQCLVASLSDEIDRGEDAPECHPLLVRQNRWRACRYGLGAALVDPTSLQATPVRHLVARLARRLRPVADRLGCRDDLLRVRAMAAQPAGAERQLALFEQTGDPVEVARRLVRSTRMTPEPVAEAAPNDPRFVILPQSARPLYTAGNTRRG